jgi:hypothetical protein
MAKKPTQLEQWAISKKIVALRREGKTQDEAVAIAFDMWRRNSLPIPPTPEQIRKKQQERMKTMEKKQIKIIIAIKVVVITIIAASFDTVSCMGELQDTAVENSISVELETVPTPPTVIEEPKQEIIVPTAHDTATPPVELAQ